MQIINHQNTLNHRTDFPLLINTSVVLIESKLSTKLVFFFIEGRVRALNYDSIQGVI